MIPDPCWQGAPPDANRYSLLPYRSCGEDLVGGLGSGEGSWAAFRELIKARMPVSSPVTLRCGEPAQLAAGQPGEPRDRVDPAGAGGRELQAEARTIQRG